MNRPVHDIAIHGRLQRAETIGTKGSLNLLFEGGRYVGDLMLCLQCPALAQSLAGAINATIAAHDTHLPDGDDIVSFDFDDEDLPIIPPGFVVSLGFRVTLGRVVPRAPDDATDEAQLVYARLYDDAHQSVPMPDWMRSRLPLERYEALAIEAVRDGAALRPAAE